MRVQLSVGRPDPPLTLRGLAILVQDMEPTFTVRIDWTCWSAYGDPVVVELHVPGNDPQELSHHTTWSDAAAWTKRWFDARCLTYGTDIDARLRQCSTYLTLWPESLTDQGRKPETNRNAESIRLKAP